MLVDASEIDYGPGELAHELMAALGQEAEAVYRYGLHQAGDGGNSAGRLLVVAHQVDMKTLRVAGSAAVRARKLGFPVRLDTAQNLVRAADTHPVFTLTLMDTRELLAGTEVLNELVVEMTDLRLRVEQSLRSLIHGLTDEFLFAPRNEMRIERLLRRVGHRLIYLLAGLLMVKGKMAIPVAAGDLGGPENIEQCAAQVLDQNGVRTLRLLRRYALREVNLAGNDLHDLLDATLALLQALVQLADEAGETSDGLAR
jgi:hypothetical protein